MSQKVVKIVASADGTQIYADAIGDPQKPALVFLHGFSTSASVFNDIFTNPSYSEDFFLVSVYDHGMSELCINSCQSGTL